MKGLLPCVANGVVILLVAASSHAQTIPFTPVAVGRAPEVDVFDTRNGKVFVPNLGSNTVSVIDAVTCAKTADIPTRGAPSAVSFNATTNKLYVVNNTRLSVTVINTITNAVITTISLPASSNPWDLGLNEITGYGGPMSTSISSSSASRAG